MGAPNIINVSAQIGEEVTESGCLVDRGKYGEGLIRLWDTDDGGSFVQVLGVNVVVLQQQLNDGGTEPTEGTGKVGTTGEDFGKGGIG